MESLVVECQRARNQIHPDHGGLLKTPVVMIQEENVSPGVEAALQWVQETFWYPEQKEMVDGDLVSPLKR